MGILLVFLGGFFNVYKCHQIFSRRSDEEMPFKSQGYFMAFLMGCIFYGLPMYLLYWVIK
jgi:hypothetical protein